MTKRNIKQGFEFSLDGKNLYKVTSVNDKTFLAIWIGDYSDRDMVTYNGFIREGHFSLDQALFQIKNGKIIKVESASGIMGLVNETASKKYKKAVGVS